MSVKKEWRPFRTDEPNPIALRDESARTFFAVLSYGFEVEKGFIPKEVAHQAAIASYLRLDDLGRGYFEDLERKERATQLGYEEAYNLCCAAFLFPRSDEWITHDEIYSLPLALQEPNGHNFANILRNFVISRLDQIIFRIERELAAQDRL